eukprot:GCRY01005845.1.p1 GENE.GCRY01005845.1~~GCRY01005845.1.p1  ORF type:complete len:394 (-),score=50.53 GCRY01005845.1:38-1219(-)
MGNCGSSSKNANDKTNSVIEPKKCHNNQVGDSSNLNKSSEKVVENNDCQDSDRSDEALDMSKTYNQRYIRPPRRKQTLRIQLTAETVPMLPEQIKRVNNLKELHLIGSNVKALPPVVGCQSLSSITIECPHLLKLPPAVNSLSQLQSLVVHSEELKIFPSVMTEFSNLSNLEIIAGKRLQKLPKSISMMSKLSTLKLHCPRLKKLPSRLDLLSPTLTSLDLCCPTAVMTLEIFNLNHLRVLKISQSLTLLLVPEDLGRLKSLVHLEITDCVNLATVWGLGALAALETLVISGTCIETLPREIGNCTELTVLNLNHNKIGKLPGAISHCKKLAVLDVSHNQLHKLPAIFNDLSSLSELHLDGNPWNVKIASYDFSENSEELHKMISTLSVAEAR